jgi:nucleoside-diphosphate-sugar epimerase
MKHFILGAGGAISNVLSRELIAHGESVRLVSRSGVAVAGAESVRADLLDPVSVRRAVDEGSTAYLLAGLAYRTAIWQAQWPQIMRNTIDAVASRGARLIFFDNVYMYGRVDGVMTEETPIQPTSRKGEVRARIASDLLDAARNGRIKASIARSADFYGTDAKTSVLNLLVFQRLAKGKKAQWLVNADVPHSFTYIPDAARALPLMAAADVSWGEVWHLPTAAPPWTGRELVAAAARALKVEPRLTVLAPWMVRLAGIFNGDIRESVEMLYQSALPYWFDSSKFERRFGVQPTPYSTGIAETSQTYKHGSVTPAPPS